MKATRLGFMIALIVTLSAACAGTGATPPLSMTATTLTAGWEQHFTVEWATAEQSQSSRKVSGYVYNRHGEFATHLRVLAQAVDAGGAVIGQRIAFVPGGVGGFGRAYFEVPNLPATAACRISSTRPCGSQLICPIPVPIILSSSSCVRLIQPPLTVAGASSRPRRPFDVPSRPCTLTETISLRILTVRMPDTPGRYRPKTCQGPTETPSAGAASL